MDIFEKIGQHRLQFERADEGAKERAAALLSSTIEQEKAAYSVSRKRERFARLRSRSFLVAAGGFAGAAVIAVFVLSGGGVKGLSGDEIAQRAAAATAPKGSILHMVVKTNDSGAQATESSLMEGWLADNGKEGRILIKQENGKVGEGSFTKDGSMLFYDRKANEYSEIKFPKISDEEAAEGFDPLANYRKTLRSGKVRSKDEVTVDGRAAYKLVVDIDDSSMGGGWTREVYVVDRETYFPIEDTTYVYKSSQKQNDKTQKPWMTYTARYLTFEYLPRNEANERYLKVVRDPGARHVKEIAPLMSAFGS